MSKKIIGVTVGTTVNPTKIGGAISYETLETENPEYDIPDMYTCEDKAFLESCESGIKTRSHIDNILESAKLLDALYQSSNQKSEVVFK